MLQLDRGAGFTGELRVDKHMSTLRWRTCLYVLDSHAYRLTTDNNPRGSTSPATALCYESALSLVHVLARYEEIFSKEEKRELLGCVCCSADRYFFEGQRKYKAGLKLPAKAEGEEECVWYVINRTKRL